MKPKDLIAKIKAWFSGNRPVVCAMKYIPVICTLLLSVHIAFLLVGWNEPVTVIISVALLLVLLVLLSFRFHFCKLHKAMICFMALMTLCILLQKYGVFGYTLIIFRVLMLVIGLVLGILAIIKAKDDECAE